MAKNERNYVRGALFPVHSVKESAGVYFQATPFDRVAIVKSRLAADYVELLAKAMSISKEALYGILQLPRATIDRKIRNRESLSQEESERVLGVVGLIGQADQIVRESGDGSPFDAARWMGAWLQHPHRALDRRRPGDLMDTADGRSVVSTLLAQQQSGVYI